MERHERVIRNVHDLPTLPEVVQHINRMLSDPRTDAKQVSRVIARDPSLTAKLLRVVNSSFYSFPNPVTKTSMAIVVLGYNTIKSIILGASVFGAFPAGSAASWDRAALWRHAMGAAAAARTLARRRGMKETEPYFIGGLLHDLGKIVEELYFEEEFAAVRARVAADGRLMREAEQEVMGTDHAQLGAVLLERWELSGELIDAVRHHHQPEQATVAPEFAAALHLADALARALLIGDGGDRAIPAVSPAACARLGLTEADFPALLDEVAAENEKARVFWELA